MQQVTRWAPSSRDKLRNYVSHVLLHKRFSPILCPLPGETWHQCPPRQYTAIMWSCVLISRRGARVRGCETTAAEKKKKSVGSVAVCVPCRSSEKLMGRMVGGSLPLWRHTGFCVNSSKQVLCLRLRHFKRKKFIKAHAMYSIQWMNTIITVCMYCAAEYYSPLVVSRYISGCIVAKCSIYLCTPSRVDSIDPRTVWADKERLQLSVPSLHWHGNHKRIIIYLLVTWNRGVKVLS